LQPHDDDQPALPADVEVLESSVDAGRGWTKGTKLRRGASTHGPVEPPGGEVDLPASNIICTYKALQRRTIPCDICNPLSFRFLDGIRSKAMHSSWNTVQQCLEHMCSVNQSAKQLTYYSLRP